MSKDKEQVNIAEKLRQTLLQTELRYLQAETVMLTAQENFKKYNALGGKANQRKAQKENIKVRVYQVYMGNIKTIKLAAMQKLNTILDGYTDNHKVIFVMYFIERRSIEDISNEIKYSRRQVDRLIAKFKEDLDENSLGGENK